MYHFTGLYVSQKEVLRQRYLMEKQRFYVRNCVFRTLKRVTKKVLLPSRRVWKAGDPCKDKFHSERHHRVHTENIGREIFSVTEPKIQSKIMESRSRMKLLGKETYAATCWLRIFDLVNGESKLLCFLLYLSSSTEAVLASFLSDSNFAIASYETKCKTYL